MAWLFGNAEHDKLLDTLMNNVSTLAKHESLHINDPKRPENVLFVELMYILSTQLDNKSSQDYRASIKSMLWPYPTEKIKELVSTTESLIIENSNKRELVNRVVKHLTEAASIVHNPNISTFIVNTLSEKDVLTSEEVATLREEIMRCVLKFLMVVPLSKLTNVVTNADGYKKIVDEKETLRRDVDDMKSRSCVKSAITTFNKKDDREYPRSVHTIVNTHPVVVPEAFREKMEKIHASRNDLSVYLNKHREVNWRSVSRDVNLLYYMDSFSKREFESLDTIILYERFQEERELREKYLLLKRKWGR